MYGSGIDGLREKFGGMPLLGIPYITLCTTAA